MRTPTAQELMAISGGRAVAHARVRVKDASGTFRDLSSLFGRDWLMGWEVDEEVDQPVAQCRVTVAREAYLDSLAALRTDTRPNLLTGSYAPLLYPGAEMVLEVALVPEGAAPASNDWRELFRGDIDLVDCAANPMTFSARDLGGRLQDLWLQAEAVYGTSVGVQLELVAQQLTKDVFGEAFEAGATYAAASGTMHGDRVTPTTHNGRWYRVTTGGTAGAEPAWPATIGATVSSGGVTFTCAGVVPTLYTPAATSFAVTSYVQKPQSVLEASRALAQLLGWDVRYAWRSATAQFELTLAEPDRAKSTPDHTFDADHYFAVPTFVVDRTTVRSLVEVVYSDSEDLDTAGQPKRKTVSVQDKDSMDRYSGGLPRWCQIAEASTSQIDTAAEALTLANAVLSDLKDPKAEAQFDVPLFPFAQLGDLYRFTADNVRYTADQDLALTGVRHTGDASGKARTTLSVRGKPVAGVRQWLRLEAGDIAAARAQGPSAPTNVTVSTVQGGLTVSYTAPGDLWFETELHLSTSSGFTPSSSTFRGRSRSEKIEVGDLTPGVNYYGRLLPRDAAGNPGELSEEFTIAAGYTPPRAMQPRAVYDRLPFNPDFEIFTTGTGSPPDAWFMANGGVWGSIAEDAPSDVQSGGHAIHFLPTGPFNTHPTLYSEAFPVVPGEIYEISVYAKRPVLNGGGYFILNWLSDLTGNGGYGTTTGSPVGQGILSSTTYVQNVAVGVAPAGAKYARVEIGASTLEESWFDNVTVRSLGPDWRALTLGTNWTSMGLADYGDPYFYRNAAGMVVTYGIAKNTNAGSTIIGTYPAGFRPGKKWILPIVANDTFGVVEVQTNGDIVMRTTPVLNQYHSLASITFRAEG